MTVHEAIEPAPVSGTTRTPYKRIVVALDGSALAEAIFPYVEPLARAFDSTITFVCALEPLSATITGEMSVGDLAGGNMAVEQLVKAHEIVRREDKSYIDGIRRRFKAAGFQVTCSEPEERAADAIVKVAREQNADLIAMTTHGRTGLGRALLGSVADDVLRHAPCPVLIVHPSTKR